MMMMMMLTMTMLFLTMFLTFGNPGLGPRQGAEQRCPRLFSSRGDIGREHLRGEQRVLLFTATLVIQVKGTTSTGIELQDSFAED